MWKVGALCEYNEVMLEKTFPNSWGDWVEFKIEKLDWAPLYWENLFKVKGGIGRNI